MFNKLSQKIDQQLSFFEQEYEALSGFSFSIVRTLCAI